MKAPHPAIITDETPAWRVGPASTLELDRPRVMAILNLTPDSFSDGGQLATAADAARAAADAIAHGADVLDLGGESTRPGAARIDAAEQIRRVVPAVRAIRDAGITAPITIDTTLRAVAEAALNAGATAINDVAAGEEDDTIALAAERGCGLILMHRLRPPDADRFSDRYERAPAYTDVIADVADHLRRRVETALNAGSIEDSLVIDPGLGFGKSVADNLALVRRTNELRTVCPRVLSAASRKSFVGRVSLARDSDPAERDAGSVAFSVAHLAAGARLFRVHAPAMHTPALRAAWALWTGSEPIADSTT